MKLPFGKPGLSRFIFVALVLVFNWPLLSIPTGKFLFFWLFSAWALAIAILFAAARWTAGRDAASRANASPTAAGEPDPGADSSTLHAEDRDV